MSARVCTKHGTPEYCPDGVCRWCVPLLPVIAVETRKNPSLPERIRAEPVPGPITRSILDLLDRYPTAFGGKPAPVSLLRVIADEASEILDALDPLHNSAACPICRSFLPLLLEQAT